MHANVSELAVYVYRPSNVSIARKPESNDQDIHDAASRPKAIAEWRLYVPDPLNLIVPVGTIPDQAKWLGSNSSGQKYGRNHSDEEDEEEGEE